MTSGAAEAAHNVAPAEDFADAAAQEHLAPETAPRPKRPLGERLLGALGQVRGFWAFVLLLLTAVVSGCVDPDFGWNPKSLRLVIVFFIVFILLNYTGAFIKWAVAKKRGVRPRMMARPIYLLILIITVIFARGTGVQPALVFGTVIALDYATQDVDTGEALSRGRAAAAALAGSIWAFILGIAAWLAYTFIAHHPFQNLVTWDQIMAESAVLLDDALSFGSLVAIELSFTLAIAALGSMPLMLLPLKMFDGGAIWRWHRSVWLVTYIVAITLYSTVLVPLPASWDAIDGTIAAWIAVFVAYSVIVVVIALLFRFAGKKAPTTAEAAPLPDQENAPERAATPQ